MACVGLISLIRTVELNFLEPRPRLVVDYNGEIQCLRQRLSVLVALLQESEKKLSVSQTERDVIARVKQISFRAEDDIESEVMEILSNGASHERLHQILQRLAEDTEELIEQRNTTQMSSYNPAQSNQEHVIPGGASKLQDDAIMVGHAQELEKMKEMLLQRSTQERQVISIVGMGGIGKTTMAKNIYDDPSIRFRFHLLGWATVSQDYDLRRILQDLYGCVAQMTDKEINEVKSTAELANKVRRRLMRQRYLLVVDDIWGSRGWDDLQRCFPDDSNGSRILLTTRLKEVADYSGCSGKYVCNLPFLNSNESWKLFSQKLGSIKLPPEVEAIGMHIVNKCRGLPLAISVAAGLLSKTKKSVESWQSIASAMNLPMTSDLHDQCSTILTLSYNNLPYHLKACFLYFGVFPKVRREIPTKDLLNLWIAEGFVMEDSGRSLEDGAMDYLQDLIGRNLVLISTLSFIGNIKTCRLHDLLFDLCLREVEKEKFVSAFHQRSEEVGLGYTEPLFEYANRWLTFQTMSIQPKFGDNYNFHKSRTLLFFFGNYRYFGMLVSWRQNMSFKMIRVLDLRTISFDEAPTFDISDLILLRYLALDTIKYVRVLKHHHSLQTLIVKFRSGLTREVDDEAFKDLMARVKDITFKAEGDVESQVMEIVSMGNQPSSLEGLHQILQSLAQDIDGVIECIKKRRNVKESYSPQSVSSSIHDENITVGGSTRRISKLDEEEMVGHAMELARMKEMLLQGSPPERQVVSIVGMGGIGKTTFAKIIYDDLSIRSHFDLHGWTTVSQDHNLRKILHHLCHSIAQMTNDEISKVDTVDLANKLRQCLMGQRYLLVMDDVWDTKVWDDVHRCFPDDSNGSRILLTTRLKEVAHYAGLSKYICTLPFLNLDESWKLFYSKVSNEETLPVELEKIGKRIIHKCQGLPIAIVIVAGLLSKTIKSPENWESVASAINLSATSTLHEQCSKILTLSYNDLPYHLKSCFLYFSVFPEDYEIPTKDLIKLWMAEGFIKVDSQRDLEEVGSDYLQDLIGRNLVLISELSLLGNIKTCRMHDLLYDLCLREAKDEKLLSVIYEEIESVQLDETQPKCYDENGNRWLRFQSWSSFLPNFNCEKYTFHKYRTLFFYGPFITPWTLCNSFKRIRVLDLSLIMFIMVPIIDIEDLILLRYLRLRSFKYVGAIKHHCNLQTLIVEDPNVDGSQDDAGREWLHGVWKSQSLRYIKCPFQFPNPNIDEDVVQENLQTLYWLPDFQCTKQFVLRIPNVQVIAIRCSVEESEFQVQTWWENLCYLAKLKKLKVCSYWCSTSPLPSIISTFPQQLKKLTLIRVLLQWEAINAFSMLPNLEVLKLIRAECMGEKWEIIDGGFLKLKFLFIHCAELKYWSSTGDHFPVLERLALHNCYDLEEIPMGFVDVLTLQLIDLKACTPSLVESARQIRDEQENLYGYDELIVRDYDTYSGAPPGC
ncbi:PREDICTED: putative late blight resistance protein homolog R1B-8 [Ipomoea nil]|uniref:putative late blight resistance protein homolog R1B-8 n=1 Tax=Ipomoea nil TaxID=35883 RepID=UPI000900DD8B|nr:PREDICTED: putative late blight resistance protein homolog R1B-8 [Ipomoea nil]